MGLPVLSLQMLRKPRHVVSVYRLCTGLHLRPVILYNNFNYMVLRNLNADWSKLRIGTVITVRQKTLELTVQQD